MKKSQTGPQTRAVLKATKKRVEETVFYVPTVPSHCKWHKKVNKEVSARHSLSCSSGLSSESWESSEEPSSQLSNTKPFPQQGPFQSLSSLPKVFAFSRHVRYMYKARNITNNSNKATVIKRISKKAISEENLASDKLKSSPLQFPRSVANGFSTTPLTLSEHSTVSLAVQCCSN